MKVILSHVRIPVVRNAEENIALGISFVAFRNEQVASHAATTKKFLRMKLILVLQLLASAYRTSWYLGQRRVGPLIPTHPRLARAYHQT